MMLFSLLLAFTAGSAAAGIPGVDAALDARDFATALELIDAARARDPGNSELEFRRAQVLRYSGQARLAVPVLDDLRNRYPDDVDIAYERALTLAALERNVDALDDVNAAILLAPDYEDLWILRFRLLRRDAALGGDANRERWRAEASSRFPGRSWHELPAPVPLASWTLSTGGSYDQLDKGFADWNRQFIGLARETARGHRHAVELSRNARGSTADVGLAITADYRLGQDWLAGVYLGTAVDPVFLPRVDIGAHGGRVLPGDWVVDLALRHRDFSTTAASSATATVEKYVGPLRIAYRFSVSRVTDSPSFTSQGLTVNWYYTDAGSIGLQYGTGREIESLGGGRLLETEVDSVAVTGRHSLNERLTLDWFAGIHDQGTLYRRQFLGLAVSFRL